MRSYLPTGRVVALTACLSLVAPIAHGQAPVDPPRVPSLRLVMPGERISITEPGYLLSQEDVVWFRQRIEALEFRIGLTERFEAERCELHLTLERERTQAAEARSNVLAAASDADRAALAEELREAQQETRRAERARRAWFRSPAMWFAIGALSTGALVLGLR